MVQTFRTNEIDIFMTTLTIDTELEWQTYEILGHKSVVLRKSVVTPAH